LQNVDEFLRHEHVDDEATAIELTEEERSRHDAQWMRRTEKRFGNALEPG